MNLLLSIFFAVFNFFVMCGSTYVCICVHPYCFHLTDYNVLNHKLTPTDIITAIYKLQRAVTSINKPSCSGSIKLKSMLALIAPLIFVYLKSLCNYCPAVSDDVEKDRDSLQLINYGD